MLLVALTQVFWINHAVCNDIPYPVAFVGTQSIWNNGSVQVTMLDTEGRRINIVLRGKSDSNDHGTLIVLVDRVQIESSSNVGISLRNGIREMIANMEDANWKKKKLNLLLEILERANSIDGTDVRELLKDQPFQEIFRELQSVQSN
jgi:hypothetical protein